MTTKTQYNALQELTSKDLHLKNKIVMAPMTRSRAINNLPNDLMATYYGQRASVGLIITEGTSPSPNGLGYSSIPGIYSNLQTDKWKKISTTVHKKEGKIFMQLMHTGRISHKENMPEGARILAPSAVRPSGEMWTDQSGMQPFPIPEAMSLEDINQSINEFTQAAENAINAGFDGIELHGANGYLLEQFLNPEVNKRNDTFGGSLENRIRYVYEVTKAVVQRIGAKKVGIRLSPFNTFNDMPLYDNVYETYQHLVEKLNSLDINYIHLVEGPSLNQDNGPSLLSKIREIFSNTIILNGGYDLERAEHAISSGQADLISFGRPLISNPDFVERLKNQWDIAEANPATFYSPGEKGYTDYPTFD
ncbi:alkene reductase [Membranihabitans maritimus]|uniref:alkene reductase n=1 Tax=Membranihabitans maritimus TaxID=2904244 RepID=UPI001F36EE07|nr:alkene reductase [Membranihabitans maritimus]